MNLWLRVALVAMCICHGGTYARTRRTSEGQRLHVGPPAGPVVTERIDSERTAHSRVSLPREASISWYASLPSGFAGAGLVDSQGVLFLVTGAKQVGAFDATGKRLWTRDLDREVATAPVLTNAGLRFLLTRSGRMYAFDALGKNRIPSARSLESPRDSELPSMPSQSGGVVLALDSRLVTVDDDGQVVSTGDCAEPVAWLLGAGAAVIAVLEDGAVVEWQAHALRHIATLGHTPALSPAIDGRRMFVVVAERLLALDLDTGATTPIDARPNDPFASAPTVVGRGKVAILTEAGTLLGYDANGTIPQVEHLGGIQVTSRGEHHQLISDSAGGFLAATVAGELTLFGEAGQPTSQSLDCSGPPLLLPHAAARLLYVCPSGQLWGIGGPPRTQVGELPGAPGGPGGTGPGHP